MEVLGEAAADRAIASQAMPGVPSKPSDVFLRPLRDLMQSTSDPSVYARAGIALDGLRSKRMSAAEMRAAFAQWPSGALTGVSEGLMERERQGDVQCGVERSCFEEMARGLTGAMLLEDIDARAAFGTIEDKPNMVRRAQGLVGPELEAQALQQTIQDWDLALSMAGDRRGAGDLLRGTWASGIARVLDEDIEQNPILAIEMVRELERYERACARGRGEEKELFCLISDEGFAFLNGAVDLFRWTRESPPTQGLGLSARQGRPEVSA